MTDIARHQEDKEQLVAFARAVENKLKKLIDRRIDPYSGLTAAHFVRGVIVDMKKDGIEPPIMVLKHLEELEERHFGKRLANA